MPRRHSSSPAWRARLVADDGTALADPRAVTVDGWKQGWVLPAAATGATLVLTVPLDVLWHHRGDADGGLKWLVGEMIAIARGC